MSARRSCSKTLVWLVFGACGPVIAVDVEEPGMELLEYLGLWEESDEEWLMIDRRISLETDSDERTDPAPEGEGSTEKDDEG